MNEPIVIKIGGSTLGNHDTTLEDIVTLQKQGKHPIVVHGGGKIITEWLYKQNIVSQFVRGERITDRASLDVVVAVLAGLLNKEIVADIIGLGGRAIGLSGVDGSLIGSKIRDPEIGYVGTVNKVNPELLETLLKADFVPVVAPVGLNLPYVIGYVTDCPSCGHGESKVIDSPIADSNMLRVPRFLNINADIVAGEIAAAVGADKLVFLTDVAGVMDRLGNLLPRLSSSEAETMIASGAASGGMIPKLNACLRAVSGKATACIIDGRKPHALLNDIEGKEEGTIIKEG